MYGRFLAAMLSLFLDPPLNLCIVLCVGETHLHMQQYIRATQLPITKKFTLSPFSKEEVSPLVTQSLS